MKDGVCPVSRTFARCFKLAVMLMFSSKSDMIVEISGSLWVISKREVEVSGHTSHQDVPESGTFLSSHQGLRVLVCQESPGNEDGGNREEIASRISCVQLVVISYMRGRYHWQKELGWGSRIRGKRQEW